MPKKNTKAKRKSAICAVRKQIAAAYLHAVEEAEEGPHRAAAERILKHLSAALKASKAKSLPACK